MSRRSVISALVALATAAHADTPVDRAEAIEVDRADAPPGRSELGFDGGAPLDGFGVTIATSWIEKPIAIGDLEPVRRRQTLVVGAAVAMGTIVFDARIGAAHQIGDRLGTGALDKYVSTDLRAGVRVRVAGDDARAVFVRADASLPTGDDGDFAGEESWSLAWRLVGRATVSDIVLAASAGIRLRGAEVIVGDRLVGDEAMLAAGVVVPVPALQPLWCAGGLRATGEFVATLGDDVGVGKGPSPLEARVGLVGRPSKQLSIGVRVGAGLNDEIGAPRYRATIELTMQR